VKRLQTKTSDDVFKVVLKNDYDVFVLLETSLVVHSTTKNYSIQGVLIFRCNRSLSTSSNKSSGGVLIAVKSIFDVNELSTKNLSLVEHECAKIKCNDFSLYASANYLASDVGKRAYELFVEDIEAITDNSGLRDVILTCQKSNVKMTRRAAFIECKIRPRE
jgi:hypothetical protein